METQSYTVEKRKAGGMAEGEILFVEDIARLFHISANTVRRRGWRQRNGIPLRRVGKKLCGLKTEIDRWFKGLSG